MDKAQFCARIYRAMRHKTLQQRQLLARTRARRPIATAAQLALTAAAFFCVTAAENKIYAQRVSSGSSDSPVLFEGSWILTEYWIARETVGPRDRTAVPLQARDGRTLTYATPKFLSDLSMEGTGMTWDQRLFNWDGRVEGQARFIQVDRTRYPYGIGVQGYALVPYRSLAVDRQYLRIGHTVEIAELVGLPLPDGSRHDGCFVAVDGGGAIQGHHIDFFVPSESEWQRLSRERWLPTRIQNVVMDAPRCNYARQYAWQPLSTDPSIVP
jgi:3D (Asp-Asp-Asp) domain-containing protein